MGHLPQFCFIEVNSLGVPLDTLWMPSMGDFGNAFLREFGDSTSKMPNLGNFWDAFELLAIENFGMPSVGIPFLTFVL